TLAEIGRPVDAVFTVTSAARTVEIAREAATLGAGGLVTIAGGFAEAGPEGAALQHELQQVAAAAALPVVGPNGVGMANVRLGTSLLMQAPFPRRAGGLSAVFHSGSMVEALGAAAARPGGLGINLLISAGNEAVTDMADYVDALVDDEHTRVIALGIEAIRRPEAFFAAAARALEAGIPILALKTGRSERSQRMAASHTGAIVGDAWVYDVAMRQAGIQIAADIDELVQRAHLLERLPVRRWSRAGSVAVLTTTGGFAQLVSDLADVENVSIPDLPSLGEFVRENIPGGSAVANPLDATGFAWSNPELWERIVATYAASDDVDVLWFPSQHGEWDEVMARSMAETFARVAGAYPDKPFILSSLAGRPGEWLEPVLGDEVVLGDGIRGTLRGIATMSSVVSGRPGRRVVGRTEVAAIPRPSGDVLSVAEGAMLGFADTMRVLEGAGIPVARFALLTDPADPVPEFNGPYVAKLADVAHRTELDAVRVGVTAEQLPGVVAELQAIARAARMPRVVAVQEMVRGIGEVFIGVQTGTELGPVVAFGLGGVFVEVLDSVDGLMAPFTATDADDLIARFDRFGLIAGHRGRAPWPRDALVDLLVAIGRLADGGREWIASLDLNPILVTSEGLVAVDALCLLRH
ncbi:MAG TPA: acetate--CoA ligase family protein, partial [Pseudolysinimonas sp.]|nr:acetate--CoA ligase family protein [Pseudolysinimonas sp.]